MPRDLSRRPTAPGCARGGRAAATAASWCASPTASPVEVGRVGEDVQVEEERRRPRPDHRTTTAPTPRAGSCCRTARPSATSNGPRPASPAPGASSSGCIASPARRWPSLPPPARPSPRRFPTRRRALRRAAHKTIAGVSADIEAFHFNKAVARLYELANAIDGAASRSDEAGQLGAARGAGDLRAPDRPDDAASRRGAVAGARPHDAARRFALAVGRGRRCWSTTR